VAYLYFRILDDVDNYINTRKRNAMFSYGMVCATILIELPLYIILQFKLKYKNQRQIKLPKHQFNVNKIF